MPFYTFKCSSCKKEKEVLQSINDKAPICDGEELKRHPISVMKRIYKPNAKPASKDGSWGFGDKK